MPNDRFSRLNVHQQLIWLNNQDIRYTRLDRVNEKYKQLPKSFMYEYITLQIKLNIKEKET